MFLHEIRPFKNNGTFTFDKEAVKHRKGEIAEMKAKAAKAETKKRK